MKYVGLIWVIILLLGIFSACTNDADYAESDDGNVPDIIEVQQEIPSQSVSESISQPIPKPESLDDCKENTRPEPEIDIADIFTGEVFAVNTLANEYYYFDTYKGRPVRYIENGSKLEAELYLPTFVDSQHLLIHDFEGEAILRLSVVGDELFVITSQMIYYFDSDWSIIATADIPWHVFDTFDAENRRLDYARSPSSFVINNALSQMVYRADDGIYAIALREEARPKLLTAHLYVPVNGEDETKVSKYLPVCFISESEVLVAVSGWEWWGLFAIINVNTGEIRQLIDDYFAELRSTPQEAIIFDGQFANEPDSYFYYLNYANGEMKDAPFLREYLLIEMDRGIFSRFYSPRYFPSYREVADGEDIITFHYADYEAGEIIELPFSIKAGNFQHGHIAWVSPSGDMLIRYRAGDYKDKYALALATK